MSDEKIAELSKIIGSMLDKNEVTIMQLHAFLNTVFIQTSAMIGYGQEFFDEICDDMKMLFNKQKKKMK